MKKVSSFRRELFLRRLMIVGIISVPVAILCGVGFFIYRSESLRITSVEVSGNVAVPSDEIIGVSREMVENSFWGKLLGGDHRFAWNAFSPDVLKDRIFRLDEVSAAADEGRVFRIDVSEREEAIIWCLVPSVEGDPKKCFWVDDKGNIFTEGPDAEGALVRVVNDRTGRSLDIKDAPLSGNDMDNFRKVSDIISEFGWVVSDITLSDAESKEMKFKLPSGQELYFSLATDPSFGRPIIRSLMDSGEWQRVQYLDLRVEGKGFYKLN